MTDQNDVRNAPDDKADERDDDATNQGASSTAPAEGADDAPPGNDGSADDGSPGEADARSK